MAKSTRGGARSQEKGIAQGIKIRESELEVWKRAARARKISLSSWVRAVCNEQAKRVEKAGLEPEPIIYTSLYLYPKDLKRWSKAADALGLERLTWMRICLNDASSAGKLKVLGDLDIDDILEAEEREGGWLKTSIRKFRR